MKYRPLNEKEIEILQRNNCRCDDWKRIEVKYGFDPGYIHNTTFSGNVKLGVFNNVFNMEGGIYRHSGVFNANIHNCDIGDNVLIENIHNCIANYEIGEGTSICNVDTISVTGTTTFGNGTKVAVLDETGGREVVIFDELSSHFAYVFALYKYRSVLIDKMSNLVNDYVKNIVSDKGKIGRNTNIRNSGYICNVKTGENCTLEGVSKLTNGSITSTSEAPVYIGYNVIANNFIIGSGSTVEGGVILDKCFIGQSCILRNGFTVRDSLFFSNSQGENGEACAIFAGPYTVTHHKSTLLIGGMFSFMNAGSGTNQSNHLYKLGPVHQGIAERGSKTSSNSYVMWPAHIGAFSLIMGKHTNHPDSSQLPFSYLIEGKDAVSYLVPAVTLRTVGLERDSNKWHLRDKRKDKKLLDHINFSVLNPFSVGKMINGIIILEEIRKKQGKNTELYSYKNCVIANSALNKGIRLYHLAINKYFGNIILGRLKAGEPINTKSDKDFKEEWIDVSGLIAPKKEIDCLLEKIIKKELTTIDEINDSFLALYGETVGHEWNWAYNTILNYYNLTPEEFTDNLKMILEQCINSIIELDEMISQGAIKEYNTELIIGFGIDGTVEDQMRDMEAVRGGYETNSFILAIKDRITYYRNIYNGLQDML